MEPQELCCDRCGTDINREFTMLLPKLDVSIPNSTLAHPERRQGTAKLRRRWLKIRYDNTAQDKRNNPRLLWRLEAEHEQLKRKQDKRINSGKTIRPTLQGASELRRAKTEILDREVTKRDIPERLPITRFINLPPSQFRSYIQGNNVRPRSMFYCASAPVTRQSEKEKRRMHFIDTDWSSEGVSWKRFNDSNLSEIHKRSWMQ